MVILLKLVGLFNITFCTNMNYPTMHHLHMHRSSVPGGSRSP